MTGGPAPWTESLAEGRFGFVRSENDPRTLKLSDFLAEELPEEPDEVDYLSPMSRIDMLDNNRLSNCVPVSWKHLTQSMSAVRGAEHVPTIAETNQLYSDVTGFREGDPSTDRGTSILSMLRLLKSRGEIQGYAAIDPQDWKRTQLGIYLFGGALLGLALPLSIQGQKDWALALGKGNLARPGSLGLHGVAAHGYKKVGAKKRPRFVTSTWGRAQWIRHTFWDCGCVEEAWIVVAKDWVPPGGRTIHGFDADGLLNAIKRVSL